MSEWRVINSDCLVAMRDFAPGSFDAVITDPPYGVGIADWDSVLPLQGFLDDCLRVSSGPVIWFGASGRVLDFARYTPRPDRVLVWSPRFTLSHTIKDGLAYRWQPIYVWRIVKQEVIRWDVLDDPTECGNWWKHPASKPVDLMRKLVAGFGGQRVLDPFCGSGTTGVACAELGRDFCGIEIDPGYVAIARRRIDAATRQERLVFP